MLAPDDRAGTLPLATGLVLFIPLALAGNVVGSALRYPDIGAAVLFPPYAALTAVLVASRRRHWIWYLLAGSVAHFVTHWPQWSLSWVLAADAANIARALVAASLLRRLLGDASRLDSVSALLLFGFSAVIAAPAVGATIGAANVVWHGAATTYGRPWLGWFVSNALTGLAMLPALIVLFQYAATWRELPIRRERVMEGLLFVVALGAACAIAFVGGPAPSLLALHLYAPMLVLIWAALRFGPGGVSVALTIVALSAIAAADRGAGPFTAAAPDESILALQIFVLFTAGSMLCLAAIATGRQRVVRLYRSLLASLHDHVAILDARGVVLEVNSSWRLFADTSPRQLVHRVRVGECYVAACRAASEQGDAAATSVLEGVTSVLRRDRRHYEMEYDQTRDGRREWFTLTVEALERPDGGAVVTRSDVSARRQAQIDVEEQRRELSHLARVAVLGQLSGAIAHELNQPLAAIVGNAEAGRRFLRRQQPDVDELAAILGDIASDGQRAGAVIKRLRALFKRGEQRVQAIDARDLIDEVLQLAHAELISHHINPTTVIEPNLPPFPGDRVQVQQVLLNLILNAGEAMTAAAAGDRRLILTAKTGDANDVHIAIRDFGTGIPANLVDRLFEPFVTTKPDGLGLGLSISRTIVSAHGGRLWAETHADGGTTMHSVFPVTRPAPGTSSEIAALRRN